MDRRIAAEQCPVGFKPEGAKRQTQRQEVNRSRKICWFIGPAVLTIHQLSTRNREDQSHERELLRGGGNSGEVTILDGKTARLRTGPNLIWTPREAPFRSCRVGTASHLSTSTLWRRSGPW